jgi:hypothetical protein
MLNALTVLSLLLFVATLALWVWSYWRSDMYSLPFRVAGNRNDGFTDERWFMSVSGELHFSRNATEFHYITFLNPARFTPAPAEWLAPPARPERKIGFQTAAGVPGWSKAGFGWVRLPIKRSSPAGDRYVTNYSDYSIPHWFVAATLATLAYPGARRAILQFRQRPKGHCQNCGYDLRATPERCPECGKIPAQ